MNENSSPTFHSCLRRFLLPFGLLGAAACFADGQATEPGIAAASGRTDDPVVTVAGGALRGRALPDGKGAVYRGIPFAQPPVGNLRWREPMPPAPWQGVRDAGEPGPPAAQAPQGWNDKAAAVSREDCLYLDVWTPAAASGTRLPVMVWLHGGGNVAGAAGSDPVYAGGPLISHGVVLVVVEYRLGVFGFLSHPDLTRESPHHSSGNYALLDQLAALRWVRDNIGRFGGDAGNVTLFGQSAGSMDVLALMSSPLARGLFHRAIAESGAPPPQTNQPLSAAEKAGVERAARLGAPAANPLPFLRSLPASALLEATAKMNATFTIDGWVLPAATTATWRAGGEQRVPLIIGSAAIEFPAPGGPAGVRRAIESTFGADAPRALAVYGLAGNAGGTTDPLYGDVAEQWGSDLFRCPAVVYGEWHGDAGNPVWEYQFDRAIPPHPKVGHSGDLPYVFGALHLKEGNLVGDYRDEDRRLSATIQGYWTNFAKTGNPNGEGLPAWPGYDASGRAFLEFTAAAGVAVGHNQRGPACDLFRELLQRSASPAVKREP